MRLERHSFFFGFMRKIYTRCDRTFGIDFRINVIFIPLWLCSWMRSEKKMHRMFDHFLFRNLIFDIIWYQQWLWLTQNYIIIYIRVSVLLSEWATDWLAEWMKRFCNHRGKITIGNWTSSMLCCSIEHLIWIRSVGKRREIIVIIIEKKSEKPSNEWYYCCLHMRVPALNARFKIPGNSSYREPYHQPHSMRDDAVNSTLHYNSFSHFCTSSCELL